MARARSSKGSKATAKARGSAGGSHPSAKAPRGRPPGRPSRRRAATAGTAATEAVPPGARVIKRYGNRRLYDARLSRCVTVQEIAEFVRRGEDVRVVEDTTGQDVTRRILLQIILEEQNQAQLDLVPIELLRQLIAFRTDAQTEWLGRYLSVGTDWLRRQVASAEPAVRAAQDSFFAPWLNMDAFRPYAAPSEAPPPAGDGADGAEVLRRQVEDLQRQMSEIAARFQRR